ncbi:hypothetical protein HDU86_005118 [Geranomyces michiganensis]|nr:hypothetical protein HDU86_005118 [Geranomyces michiganensis]
MMRRAIKLLREVLAEPSGDSSGDSEDDEIVFASVTPQYLRTPGVSPQRAGGPESEITAVFTEVGRVRNVTASRQTRMWLANFPTILLQLYTKALADKAKHFEEKVRRSVARMNKDIIFIEACVAERFVHVSATMFAIASY